ncbi:unnamed protein product [Arctia plantaginis]|uniref:Uncharacterized protein n=1 Tax=Arctia plantaginis TaxID=874455 RepID=A0A8S0ZCL8_ARCPL|nr:unnamed protein product [Arctia plantaginis]
MRVYRPSAQDRCRSYDNDLANDRICKTQIYRLEAIHRIGNKAGSDSDKARTCLTPVSACLTETTEY